MAIIKINSKLSYLISSNSPQLKLRQETVLLKLSCFRIYSKAAFNRRLCKEPQSSIKPLNYIKAQNFTAITFLWFLDNQKIQKKGLDET